MQRSVLVRQQKSRQYHSSHVQITNSLPKTKTHTPTTKLMTCTSRVVWPWTKYSTSAHFREIAMDGAAPSDWQY